MNSKKKSEQKADIPTEESLSCSTFMLNGMKQKRTQWFENMQSTNDYDNEELIHQKEYQHQQNSLKATQSPGLIESSIKESLKATQLENSIKESLKVPQSIQDSFPHFEVPIPQPVNSSLLPQFTYHRYSIAPISLGHASLPIYYDEIHQFKPQLLCLYQFPSECKSIDVV